MQPSQSKEDHTLANHDVTQIDSKAANLANGGAKLKLPFDVELDLRKTAPRSPVTQMQEPVR
jgi:hypothetical protein